MKPALPLIRDAQELLTDELYRVGGSAALALHEFEVNRPADTATVSRLITKAEQQICHAKELLNAYERTLDDATNLYAGKVRTEVTEWFRRGGSA